MPTNDIDNRRFLTSVLAGLLVAAACVPQFAFALPDESELARNRSLLELLELEILPGVLEDPAAAPPESGTNKDLPHEYTTPSGIRLWLWREADDLIVAVDENGNGLRDEIDDLYAADYRDDGTIDRLVDWEDVDQDGRADRQALYHLTGKMLGPGLTAFLIEQRGDDRNFWQLDRWQYVQKTRQFLCDFSGDGFFTAARYDPKLELWIPFDESPFVFRDPDGDGLTEETLRFSGSGQKLFNLRWSFDTDDDGTREASLPYDYDLSITAHTQINIARAHTDTLILRAGLRMPILRWTDATRVASESRWRRALLVYDENDQNHDPTDPEQHERWEGVIASGVPKFTQVGNPDCGRLNKRYEILPSRVDSLAVYHSGVDERIHLTGAETGWLQIDSDNDGSKDCELRMTDTDANGYFDTWEWDSDGDGEFEATYTADEEQATPVELTLDGLRQVESEIQARTGKAQGERFQTDVKRWMNAKRFVPSE